MKIYLLFSQQFLEKIYVLGEVERVFLRRAHHVCVEKRVDLDADAPELCLVRSSLRKLQDFHEQVHDLHMTTKCH